MAAPKWKTQQLWKNKYKGGSRSGGGSSWVNPGDPTGGAWNPTPDQVQTLTDLYNNVRNPGSTSSTTPPPRPTYTYTPPDYSQGPPPDAAYDQGSTAATNAYNAAMASIAAQRTAAGEDYGFDTTTGKMLENVDVSNPFSRAALMNRSFRQQDKTTMGGFGVGNRLTSGAYAAALASNKFGQGARSTGLAREFGQQLLGFKDAENTAEGTRATTMAQLMGELLQRRMQQDAINAENARAAAEAAQAEWDAQYGGQSSASAPTPAPAAPSAGGIQGLISGMFGLPSGNRPSSGGGRGGRGRGGRNRGRNR